MKKMLLFLIVLSLLPYSLAIGQQEQAEEKPDPMKDFSFVDETQPVAEKMQMLEELLINNNSPVENTLNKFKKCVREIAQWLEDDVNSS